MAIVGRTPTVAQSTSTTSVTPALPADRQPGDYVVAQFAMSCSVALFTPPPGWTAIVAPVATNNANRIVAVYGMFDPQSAPVGTSGAATDRQTAFCQAYGGVDPSFPVDAGPTLGVVSVDPISIPSVTTVTDGARLISGICADTSGHQYYPPASMTVLGVHTNNVGRAAAWADEAIPTAGPTGARAWNSDTAGTLSIRGYNVALRPATEGPAPEPTLTIGWVGALTPAGFTVSTKTANATDVRVKAGTDVGLTTDVAWSILTAPDPSAWVQHELTGLAPATAYYYAVEMTDGDGVTHLSNVAGPVKTMPTVGQPASFRAVASSCLLSGSAVTTAFDNMLAADPDLALHLGDFHYANSSSTDAATHRGHLESQITGNAGLSALLANVPVVYVKSDHDSGGGNGSLPGAYTAPNRAAHLQIVPHLPQVDPDALYHSFTVGRVKFIVTDDRYTRTTTEYLDSVQVAWLQAELATDEPVKVWVQSGPWHISDTPTDPASGGDKWCDYPDQHADLAAWIEVNAVGRILTVHGDTHSLMADDGTNAPGGVAVISASPLFQNTMVRGGPYSHGTWPVLTPGVGGGTASQYGILDFTDTGDEITIALSGRDTANVERLTMTLVVPTTEPPAQPVHVKGSGPVQTWRLQGGVAVPAAVSVKPLT